MRSYVREIIRFFRCDPRQVIGLLTELDVDMLVVEALLTKARRVSLCRGL